MSCFDSLYIFFLVVSHPLDNKVLLNVKSLFFFFFLSSVCICLDKKKSKSTEHTASSYLLFINEKKKKKKPEETQVRVIGDCLSLIDRSFTCLTMSVLLFLSLSFIYWKKLSSNSKVMNTNVRQKRKNRSEKSTMKKKKKTTEN